MIKSIVNLTKALGESVNDTEFECLETLLDKMHSKDADILSQGDIYSQDLKDDLATILVNDMQVAKQANQIKQVWIALTFRISSSKLTQAKNAFYSYL